MDKALSVHANEILKALSKQSERKTIALQLATKRVFQALTETDQQGRSVRRPQRFGDLVQYVNEGGEEAAMEATRVVVDRFARHDCSFLRITPPVDPTDSVVDADANIGIVDNSIIDIGHEALIRRWNKLQGEGEENWIRDEELDAEQYRVLLRYVDAGAVIPEEDLTRVEDWWSKRKPNSFWARRYTRQDTDGFENILRNFSRRAGQRQTPRSKNMIGMSPSDRHVGERSPKSKALLWCRGQSGNGAQCPSCGESDDRGGGGDCEQSGLGGHFSPPVGFELSSGCELAHPGRPRCDGHHRWREFPAFAGLAALSVDAAIRRYAAGMVLRRRASREGHRSPNQAGQASTGDGTGDWAEFYIGPGDVGDGAR